MSRVYELRAVVVTRHLRAANKRHAVKRWVEILARQGVTVESAEVVQDKGDGGPIDER